MPLPDNNTPWPPVALKMILPALNTWSAWYEGNTDHLSLAYGGQSGTDPTRSGFFTSDQGGFKATVGRVLQRWFWGEPTRGPDRRTKLHIPIAADICQASADMLFADQIGLKVTDAGTQTILDDLADDGLHTKFAEAAEIAAALGGVYVRISWDDKIADRPFLTIVDADQALPEFRYDRLQAVTFWQVLKRDGRLVYRHLEHHELDNAGNGVIRHALYQGTADNLGVTVPLTELPATAGLAAMIDEDGVISTESPGLGVVYVPNQRPQRRWRTDPLGRSLGRSDLDGIEGLMDSLDEAYSSLMRDIRLGKARIMVPKTFLESNGAGNGQSFDADQEIYASLNGLGSPTLALAQQIETFQPDLRIEKHLLATQNLIEQILRTAGYSTQTFGEGDTGTVRTATEIESKERRSLMTRDRKIRLWRPGAADITYKLLLVYQAKFGAKVTPSRPEVSFTDGVQETQLALAQTALALRNADAASTEVLVAMIHPDWDEAAIAAEVALIASEKPQLPDPTGFGGFGGLNNDPASGAAAS